MYYYIFIATFIAILSNATGLRFISINLQRQSSQFKQSMSESYDSSEVEFSGSPMDSMSRKPNVEDVICPKLPSPIFTSTSETADLCLGCK